MKESNLKKRFKKRSHMLMYFLSGSKRYFALAILFACIMALFELINPKITGYTVDFIIGDLETIPGFILDMIDKIGGREYLLSRLWIMAIVVIIIAFFGALARYFYQLFNSIGAETLVKKMRDELYSHISYLPYAWQDVNKTGDIIQRCTSDVDMVKSFLSQQLTNLIRMIVLIALALFFMTRIHGLLTLVAFLFIPVVILYSLFFHNKIGESFEKCDVEEGKLSAIAQENLTGVRVVRAFGREAYERDRFESENEIYTNLWVRMMKILSTFWVSNDLLAAIDTITIMSLGVFFTVKGQLSAGEFVSFVAYNSMLLFPVRQLGRMVSELSKAGVSIDRIMYIMNSEPEKEASGAVDFPQNGDIVFDHVSFAYETENLSSENVLHDLSFTIKKGQTVGILGSTGAGKSTIIHLLDGLYELPENCGSIFINGVDIRKIKKHELRKNIGLVLQEPYLFSRSLEENIKLAKDDAKHEEVIEAVETASLKNSILKFKDGFDTYVGERGVTLSGGQKQRTAIAQMLIRKPEIMIFDDSLSAVDAKTDAEIRHSLKKASGESTVIMISHRLTTIMHADNIFVIENGRIVESGNHEELLKLNGKYKKIYDLQSAQEV